MTTPRASGPLWALYDDEGVISNTAVDILDFSDEDYSSMLHECRLIPGHGKVVPVELVQEALRVADDFDATRQNFKVILIAIRAALEGAV